MELPAPTGLMTLLTDFGHRDPYVGIMKGEIKRRHPRADVVDLCHEVPPQAVAVGALFLGAAAGRFPAGTVHVAVVDPGVGTSRRVVAAHAATCYWVAPDNGLLTTVLADAEVRLVEIDRLGLQPRSATFHGRDVFAPLGALLASGRYGFRALGPRIEDPVRLPGPDPQAPTVLAVDGFGNLITGVTAAEVTARGATAAVVHGQAVTLHRTYADVAPGQALALINSYDLLEIAVRGGSAAEFFSARRGDLVALRTQDGEAR